MAQEPAASGLYMGSAGRRLMGLRTALLHMAQEHSTTSGRRLMGFAPHCFAWLRSIAPHQQATVKRVKTALASIVQDREMRKYTIASPGFRQARAQGVTATYLEEGDEDEYEDEGLTPSERARSSLIRSQTDAAAEVSRAVAGLCQKFSRHRQMQPLKWAS